MILEDFAQHHSADMYCDDSTVETNTPSNIYKKGGIDYEQTIG